MQQVTINNIERQSIFNTFGETATSPQQERAQISQSIGIMESIIGTHTPTYKDLPQNKGRDTIGQLDCISESMNSRHYLQWLDKQRLLKWHTVNERVVRSPYFFSAHWGVKITDKNNQGEFVVDSWYGANGDPANVQPLKQWMNND